MTKTVVVDLTPLATPTRLRGIGRYLRTLALGLSRLPSAETRGLRLVALTGLDLLGRCAWTDDFSRAADAVEARPFPTAADRYRWAYARRVALWSAVRKVGADLVHLGDPNATPLTPPHGERCRRIVTCHDLIELQFPKIYFGARDGFEVVGSRILRRRFRSADHILAISHATLNDLVDRLAVDPARISVAYNGFDLEHFSAESRPDDLARVAAFGLRDRRYVLYVGDTDWRKNVEGMLAALGRARRAGLDLDLALAGELDPPKLARLRRIAQAEGVASAVHTLGYVVDDDLRALYRHAHAHMLVSRSEGFGYPVVEAMASGCPVITTRCGSLGEVAGAAAVLVDPEDSTAMSDALLRLAAEPDFRARLVARGLARAATFSCEAQAHGTIAAFRAALESRPPTPAARLPRPRPRLLSPAGRG
jgi:glycosyltransferase involved in cell wall biosynthesis